MIITEIIEIKNRKFKHIYSNSNKDLLQKETGLIYNDVIDLFDVNYTYEEIDKIEE